MSAPLALDLETPVRDGITTFTTFVPKLLGFLRHPARRLLRRQDHLQAGRQGPGEGRLRPRRRARRHQEGPRQELSYDASDIVAKLVFFAIFIPFLSAAVGTLGISALEQPLSAFIALIPRIIVAIVLVVIGAVIAGTVKSFIDERPRRAVLRQGPRQRRQHPDPARLREVRPRPGRHRHHRHRPAALHDPRHRRRRDHHRRRRWPHQAHAEPLGDHAQQGRDRERQRQGPGPDQHGRAQHRDRRRLPGRALVPERARPAAPSRRPRTPRRRRTAPARAASRPARTQEPGPLGGRAPARRAGCPRRESNSRRPP